LAHSGTARRSKARETQESSQRFQSLLEAVVAGVVLAGPTGEVNDCNQAALDLLACARDQLVGKPVFDPARKVKREDGSIYSSSESPIWRAIATRQGVRGEVLGVYRPGARDWIWLLVNAEPRLAVDGSVIEVICSFTAMTERYDASMRAWGQVFYDWNPVTDEIRWGGDERILGYTASELSGRMTGWMDLIHPDDREAFRREVDRVIATRSPACFEYRARNRNGRHRLIRDCRHVYANDDGQVIRVAGSISEIAEPRRVEEERGFGEERFRKVFADAATGMTLQNLDGVFLAVNRAFCEITGYEERDLVGANYRSITHPEDLTLNRAGMQELLAGKVPSLTMQKRYVSKDGRVEWVRNSVSLLRDSEGTPMQVIVLVEDITGSKQDEEALRASEERFRKVFAHAATGMTIQDAEGHFLEVNPAFCEITGYDEQELVGGDYHSITHPDDLTGTNCRTEELLAATIPSFVLEKRYLRKDGRTVWVRNSASLLGDSKPARIVTLVEDITERKQAEETLRQLSGRLLRVQDEERRRLARELHDGTAQTIAALGMNLSVVRESKVALDERAKKALNESMELADQCIRELRTLSYLLHPPILDDRGLAPALAGYAEGFAQRSGISVKLDLAPDLARLPQEVELMLFRVVQESLTNIHRHSGSRMATIRLARYPKDIVLQVRDQGHGISGKQGWPGEPGVRLGVGIAGMRERVRQIGGTLQIRSRPGGTDVEVVVPLSDPYR